MAPSEALPLPEPEPEPEPEPAPAPPLAKKAETLELSFVGDIVLGRYRIEHGVYRYAEMATPEANPFAEVADLLRADVVVGNLESPLIRALPPESPIHTKHRFGAGAQHVEQLARGGFTVVSLANNHFYDLGVTGQREGPELLAEVGVMAIGASREQAPLVRVETLVVEGWRVAFVAFATVRNHAGQAGGPQLPLVSLTKLGDEVLPLVEAARAEHDLVVIAVHWGEEYAETTRNTQHIAAHKLLAAGADLLIGHHPHVLQALERYPSGAQPEGGGHDGLIAYSLGNFLFPRNDGGAELSAVLRVRYEDGGPEQRPCLSEARVHPVYMSRVPSWRPVPAPRYQSSKTRSRLTTLSRVRHTQLQRATQGEELSDDLLVAGLVACDEPG